MLDLNQSNYLINVMRLKVKDRFRIFNESEGEYLAEIIEISSKKAVIQVKDKLREGYSIPEIWLAFSPLKNNRTDFIIEKATELGIKRFQPISFERSIVREINIKKMEMNIIQAVEQCERIDVPQIMPIVKLEHLIKLLPDESTFLYMNEQEEKSSIMSLKDEIKFYPIIIVIGPEGGFTDKELNIMSKRGTGLHLGPRILRAETACIASITLIQALAGDLLLQPRI